jgi:FtsZ-interacting cell division protein ZipA
MNKIDKDELYQHLSQFLKTKGVEFHEGTYTERIRRGCSLLTDTINLADRAVKRAKTNVDKTLSQVRQTIHEKTAPKAPPAEPPTPPPASAPPPPSTASAPAPDKTAPKAPPTARRKSPSAKSKRAKPSTRRRAR